MSHLYSYVDGDFNIAHTLTPLPDPSNFKLHTHAQAELYYFCGGSGVFHIEGSDYTLEPGDLLVMQSAEAHYIELDVSQPYERKVLHVSTASLRCVDPQGILLRPLLDRKPGKSNLYKNYQFRGNSCEHYFDTMLLPGEDPRVNIYTGLIGLLHELNQIRLQNTEPADPTQDTTAYRIIRYLNKNLDAPVTLEEICHRFFISKSQLCRIFRAATGTTVRQYLTIKRLVKARQLIEAGERATHVYLQCGFNDYSSFFRAYSKHFGHAPSEQP